MMPKQPQQQQRKNEHLFLAEKFYEKESRNGLSDIRLLHDSIPEINLNDINFKTTIFNKNINYPIYINAMTGGSIQSTNINKNLSLLSKELNIPIAVGSMSAGLKFPEVVDSYKIVRENNPDGVIIANISANHPIEDITKVKKMISADAIQLHVNTLQELSMSEGDRDFHWLNNIKNIINTSDIPVIVKEVGFGMSSESIEKLKNIGVKNIDISGSGGTNFIQIENARSRNFDTSFLNELSISTAESLIEAQQFKDELTIFSSGGIKTPLDVLKSIRFGAKYVGISGLILHQLNKNSFEETLLFMNNWLKSLKYAACALGIKNADEISKVPFILNQDLNNFYIQRKSKD